MNIHEGKGLTMIIAIIFQINYNTRSYNFIMLHDIVL